MKRLLLSILFTILAMSLSAPSWAGVLDKNYTLFCPEGLSSGTTYSIVRDHDGFIWVSTRNGIDRYDGSQFRHYRLNGNSRRGLHDGMMINLHQDEAGRLWAFTERSITYLYNPEKDIFEERVIFPSGDAVGSLQCLYSVDDELVFGVSNGLMAYTYQDSLKRQAHFLSDRIVRCIEPYRDGCLLVGTNKGLALYDPKSHRFSLTCERLFVDVKSVAFCPSHDIIWVGTNGQGLYVVDEHEGNRVVRVGDERLIVLDICPLDNDEFLICTDGNGLLLAQHVDGAYRLTPLASDAEEAPYQIHSSCVRSAMLDNDKIWLCMHYGGIVRMEPKSSIVQMSNPNAGVPSDSYAFGAMIDQQGRSWVAFNQAIGCFDQEGRCQNLYLDHQARFLCVAPMPDGTVWCGGFNTGLYHFDPVTGRQEYFSSVHGGQTNDCVYVLHVDPQGGLWVGGLAFGLTCLRQPRPRAIGDDPLTTLEYDHYSIQNVCGISQLTDSVIAVATCDGLYLVNTFTHRDEHYFLVKDDAEWQGTNYFCSVATQHGHEVWLATDGAGLLFFDTKTRTQESFGYAEGLPSLELRAVALLNDTTLCITTEKDGIFTFNTRQHRYMHSLHASGLLNDNQFQQNGIYAQGDGKVVVCGDRNSFLLSAEDLVPEVGEAIIRIDGHPIVNGAITLPAENTDLHLNFTTNDIYQQSQYQFFYRIKGLVDDWHWIGDTRRLEYPRMPAGEYELEVSAFTTQEQVLSRSVKLVVEGSFWSSVNLVLLGLVAILLLVGLLQFYLMRSRSKKHA